MIIVIFLTEVALHAFVAHVKVGYVAGTTLAKGRSKAVDTQ